jgi:hypothetical protein
VTLGRMPREEPSAGLFRSAPPKVCQRIAAECDGASRKNDQLLMLPTPGGCKNLTALRSGPDLPLSPTVPEIGAVLFPKRGYFEQFGSHHAARFLRRSPRLILCRQPGPTSQKP